MTAANIWLRMAAFAITDQPVLIAAAGVVVVLAVVLVIFMVVRSNGSGGRTSSGLGFDADQGPIGGARGPASQPRYAQPSQPNPWGNPSSFAQPTMPGQQFPASGTSWGPNSWQNTPTGGVAPWAAGAPIGAPTGAQWSDPVAQAQQAMRPLSDNRWDVPQPAQAMPQGVWGMPTGGAAPWAAGPQIGTGNPMMGQPAISQPLMGQPGAMPQMPGWAPQPYGPAAGVPMMPSGMPRVGILTVRKGPVVGQMMELRFERFSIGRAKENDLVLEDGAVSRHHSVVIRDQQAGNYLVRDENSANGTWVNGQRLHNDHQLKEGDEIQIGQILLTFTMR